MLETLHLLLEACNLSHSSIEVPIKDKENGGWQFAKQILGGCRGFPGGGGKKEYGDRWMGPSL